MALGTEQISALGLAGVPRAGPVFLEFVTSDRPGADYTEPALTGTPGGIHDFQAKSPANIPPRPDDWYTELGLTGTSGLARTLTAKAPSRGISGSIQLTITPQATLYRAPRYYTRTDLVLSIKPVNAVITHAHATHVSGSVRLTLRPQAVMAYHREGTAHNVQGNAGVEIVPSSSMRYRTWRRIAGVTTLALTPDAGLVYSAAGQRNHHVSGSNRVSVRPDAALEFTDNGISYGISGSSTVSIGFSGRVTVTRETTYKQHGRVTVSFTPAATITKGIGEPMHYHIIGGTTLALIPQGSMAMVEGLIQQHAILGHVTFGLIPQGRITVARAPALDAAAPGARRFIRIFR